MASKPPSRSSTRSAAEPEVGPADVRRLGRKEHTPGLNDLRAVAEVFQFAGDDRLEAEGRGGNQLQRTAPHWGREREDAAETRTWRPTGREGTPNGWSRSSYAVGRFPCGVAPDAPKTSPLVVSTKRDSPIVRPERAGVLRQWTSHTATVTAGAA